MNSSTHSLHEQSFDTATLACPRRPRAACERWLQLGPYGLLARLLIGLTVFTAALPAMAQSDPQQSTEEGAEALAESDFRWYDDSQDELKQIPKPRAARGFNGPNWRFSFGPFLGQMLQIGFVLALILVLSLIVYYIIKAYMKRERAMRQDVGTHVQVLTDQARIEQLPFNVREPNADLLEQAGKHYQDGEFNEAIVYLYSYMLLHLDKNRLIRLSKGKTNRQYLGELRTQPTLSGLLERTMVSFEEAFFGRHTLARNDFEACWGQLDQFHQVAGENAAT